MKKFEKNKFFKIFVSFLMAFFFDTQNFLKFSYTTPKIYIIYLF